MGKLTEEIFNESCCDGGITVGYESCRPCGCDPGANHVCAEHTKAHAKEAFIETKKEEFKRIEEKRKEVEKGYNSKKILEAMYSGEDPKLRTNEPTADIAQWRKERPIYSGVLAYFPDALLEVAYVSFKGNEQHNPGQPLHWAREKSTDQLDCLGRHLIDHAKNIPDDHGMGLHLAKVAWRALAELQLWLEKNSSSS